jgi:hypothetical protein
MYVRTRTRTRTRTYKHHYSQPGQSWYITRRASNERVRHVQPSCSHQYTASMQMYDSQHAANGMRIQLHNDHTVYYCECCSAVQLHGTQPVPAKWLVRAAVRSNYSKCALCLCLTPLSASAETCSRPRTVKGLSEKVHIFHRCGFTIKLFCA